MQIAMIAAMTENRVIGKNNDIPWSLPDDFKYFKETTKNHHVIMGRKNYESLPHKFKPLPERTNIVVTRQNKLELPDSVYVTGSLESALEIARKNDENECFIIGGGEIYKLGLDLADVIYLTEIHGQVEGDVFFPKFDTTEWNEVSRVEHEVDDRHTFSFDFVTYKRIRK